METKGEETKKNEQKIDTKQTNPECKTDLPKDSKNGCCKGKDFRLGFSFGLLATSLIAAILIFFVIIPSLEKNKQSLDSKEVTNKVESFINENLMNNGATVKVKEEAIEESGLYKVIVDAGDGQDLNCYMTKDEKILLFNGIDMEKMIAEKASGSNATPTAQTKDIPKTEKPKVEVFVMSHCPYGTQIEKGILPVAKVLGDKIDFEIKFVDYAMHGEKELNEELQQHCIKTQEPTKFVPYLECFLEAGDSAGCLTKAKVNDTKLKTCISSTDKEFMITANFADKSTYKGQFPPFNVYKEDNVKYGVGGSPTLVINEVTASSTRDSKSLLSVICSAFETTPTECATEMSSDQPAPGFGSATTTAGSEASCE